MMRVNQSRIKSHMTLEYAFTGIRIKECSLVPVDWHLTVNLVAPIRKGKTKEATENKATLAYQKLLYWLDTNLTHIVVVDVNNEDDLYIANLSSNIMMYCPGDPHDDMIVQLLHSKLTALSEGHLTLGEMHIKGSDMAVQYTYDCIDGEYGLPKTTEEYYKEGKSRDEIPWWERNDGFCFEFTRPHDSTIPDEECFKDIVDPMTEFDKYMVELANNTVEIIKEPARIVQVERWKPKKV